jgi:hypothetical protein
MESYKMSLWDRMIAKAKDIDAWRKLHMSFAEWVDAWRIIPRLVVLAYGYLTWNIIQWYMGLEPYLLDKCDVSLLGAECMVQAPTTEHMALVTAVLAVAAAVFGLYTSSGKKWNGFTHWNKPKTETPPQEEQQSPPQNNGE